MLLYRDHLCFEVVVSLQNGMQIESGVNGDRIIVRSCWSDQIVLWVAFRTVSGQFYSI